MRARALFALALLVGLTGCAAPPETGLGDIVGGAGLPDWKVGDWWRYRFTSSIYAAEFEATMVVAEANGSGFVVGIAMADDNTGPILYHLPPAGELGLDLSYDVHGVRFTPFRFPLSDNLSWETKWIAQELKLTAREENITLAEGFVRGFRITNADVATPTERVFEILYAPEVRWVVGYQRTDPDGRARERLELVEHGRGYTGEVRVRDRIAVVLVESRTSAPAAEDVAFEVDPALDTVLTACVLGGMPGRYRAEVNAPSGAGCANEMTIAPGDDLTYGVSEEIPREDGAWRATLSAGGLGTAVSEVLAYRARTVTL